MAVKAESLNRDAKKQSRFEKMIVDDLGKTQDPMDEPDKELLIGSSEGVKQSQLPRTSLAGSLVGASMSYEDWATKRRLQNGNAAQIVMESVHDEPDKVAGVLNTAKAFGALSGIVPSFSMARQFQSDFEREILRRHNAKILKNTPRLALWLRNPEFAGIAKDDLANLGWFETQATKIWNTGARMGGRVAQGFSEWRLETALSDYRHGELYEEESWAFPNDTPQSMAASQAKVKERAAYWAEKVDWFSKVGERYPKSLSARQYEEEANSGGDDAAWYEALGNYASAAVTNPAKFLTWALETAGESAPQLGLSVGATLATRNPRVGMAMMGGGSYATERLTSPEEFFHEKGLDLSKLEDVAKIINDPALMKEAAERGHIRGLVIGAFDALSVGVAGKTMGNNPLKEALAQSLSQMVLGGAGEALARVAAGQKMDWNEVMAEAFAELATTPVDMVAAGRRMGVMDRSAQAAQIVKDNLKAMSKKAQSSLLRKRMPDKFGEFVDDALKGSGQEVTYVDAGKLNEYFQSQGLEAQAVIESLDGVGIEDFERALITGGDVAIPTAQYAAQIAGTDFDAWLQENARFDPADISAAEAAEYDAHTQDLFQELVEEEAAARQAEEATAGVEAQIQDEMVARLVAAGRAEDVARNEAMIYPAFYRAMSERNGLTMEEMLARYPLPEIRGDVAEQEAAKGQEYYQSDYDRGGRAAPATINADAVLQPVELKDLKSIDGYKNARDAVEKGTFENQSGDKVLISNGAIKKWFYGKENAIKRSLAPYFHKIFEQSVTYHKGEDRFSYAAGLINLDGQNVGVRFVIKQVKDKGKNDKLYQVEGIEVVSIEETSLPPIERSTLTNEDVSVLQRGGDTHGLSVADVVEVFNSYPAKSSPLFQDGDSYNKLRADLARDNPARARAILHGSFGKMADGSRVIHLFREAKLSTFLHESGHLFLDLLDEMATKGEVSAQETMAAVQGWWQQNAAAVAKDGNKRFSSAKVTAKDVEALLSGSAILSEIKVRAIWVGFHEQFARGFEAYLMEGKAPSTSLRAAFEKFRAWLVAIYQRLASLDVKINDEMRAVFDRMLATDEAIARVREGVGEVDTIMADAASLGLTDEEYASLLKKRQAAEDEAKRKLLTKTMAPVRRAREEWFKREREKLREEVEGEINALPHYRAFEFLANGRWLGEKQEAVEGDLRLSKEQLVERYGEGILKTLPRGKRTVYAGENGADIDLVADLFGFKSGDEMVAALERSPKRVDAIELETDRVMRERHGDVLADGKIEQEALEAVHNDKRGLWLAAELKAVTEVAGIEGVVSVEASRAFAAKQIAGMQVGKAVKSQAFLAAERKAAKDSEKLWAMLARQALWQQAARRRLAKKARAAGKGEASVGAVNTKIEAANHSIENYNETVARFIRAKQRQLLNHALYAESVKVEREVAGALRRVGRLNKAISKIRAGRKRLGETTLAGDYIEPIEAILEAYEFRRASGRELDKRQALNDYITKMTDAGRLNELAIPDNVLADKGRVNYQTLSVEHLRGVVDALKNIEHMARLKGKLLMAGRQRDFDEAKQVIVDALAKNLKQVDVEWIKNRGFKTQTGENIRSYIASFTNATTMLRRIDGREDLGAVYELIKSPLDKAAYGERRMLEQSTEDIQKLYGVYSKQEQEQMAVMRQYDELGGKSFSRWNLIAMALNMGNEGNFQRLTNKRARQHLTPQEVERVKGLLDKKDWDFVQSVWDYLDGWKTKIAERDRRMRGIEPKWVENKEVVTPYGVYRGGYYPIKYDAEQGGNRRSVSAGDEEIFNEMMRGTYAGAATKDGHLKARLGNGAQSLTLDTSVIATHVSQVIHDLQFNEPIVSAWRLLNNNEVEAAFAKAQLKEVYEQLKLWLQDVGSGQVATTGTMARIVGGLRSGFTMSKLALNQFTVVQQPLGLYQSTNMVGSRNLAATLLDYGRNRQAMVDEVLAKSNIMWERRTTFNKDLMDATAKANQAQPKTGKLKTLRDDYLLPFGMLGLVSTQFYTVDVPTWAAAYKKGLKQFNGDEAKAIHYADMVVAATQGSGLFLDRSGIERGTLTSSIRQNPFVLLFTVLGSYFFAKMNRAIEATQKLRAEPITPMSLMKYAFNMSMLFVAEAATVALIKYALRNKDDGDDDDNIFADIALESVKNVLAGLPFVRDAAGAAQGFQAGTYASILNIPVKFGGQVAQGELDKALVKAAVDLAGMGLRLPSTQTNRLIDGLWRKAEGEDVSVMEYLFGRSHK